MRCYVKPQRIAAAAALEQTAVTSSDVLNSARPDIVCTVKQHHAV